MVLDYFLLIMWGFCGILQIAASYSGLYGLRLFSKPLKGYLAGIIITISAFIWFFTSDNRTIEGHITGVQGTQQFELILAGVAASIFITALCVSILHIRSKSKPANQERGLEQIRNMTFLQILLRRLKPND